ncbi:hypothetical protein BpHYR1_024927 [Brachionus plicatilis]|uniref:MARVEL domain-containing protein n=1 Tax=Brachionus plicatilis TaxID=10195 RepID=A0A3M7SH70_BRAPC|nr:hypothetical protein BpHYR1_024927 [Brachionus plicatilis]
MTKKNKKDMNENSNPGFSNIHAAPSIHQPNTPNFQQRILFNRKYILSIHGILRVALIIFQFAAWVSAAAVLKPNSESNTTLQGDLLASRSAYLFFSITGFIIAILFLLLNILNIISLGFLNRLPWNLLVVITDLLWLIPTFVVSIVAAVRETQVKSLESNQDMFNIGAFGSAAFFGFLCTIIYCVDAGLHIVPIIKNGIHSPPPYTP